jgi:hypothetical protein
MALSKTLAKIPEKNQINLVQIKGGRNYYEGKNKKDYKMVH